MTRPYERQRYPAPLLPHRIPSGRRAVEQPNAGGDGEARLTLRFWSVLLVAGIIAGLSGVLMHALLHAVQDLAADLDRITALAIGGVAVGLAVWLLQRYWRGSTDVDDSVWNGTGELASRRSLALASLSEVAVGVGASLGQEAAPKLLGAAAGSRLATATGLEPAQRRVLVACAAGAGMGAIYNVPLGGGLLTVELLLATFSLAAVLPALVCSAVATATTWVFLPTTPIYKGLPLVSTGPELVLFAALIGPLLGLLGVALVRGVGWVAHHRLRGARVLIGPLVAFALLGAVAHWQPLILGNGKGMAADAFSAHPHTTLTAFAVLLLLKPVFTLICLWSGAPGGLFTPVLSAGAVAGLLAGTAWHEVAPNASVVACALIGAAALSGAAMQAPLAATVLVVELTGSAHAILLPLVLATALATLVGRYLDGYSVFSARLPATSAEMTPV